MPEELSFEATEIGSTNDDGILNICFDDSGDQYVLLTRVDDDRRQEYDDHGGVYVEINSQAIGSVDGYKSVILEPGRLSLEFQDETTMKGLTRLVVDFQRNEELIDLTEQFAILMRGKPQYRCVEPDS
jgi:hypothetical protein